MFLKVSSVSEWDFKIQLLENSQSRFLSRFENNLEPGVYIFLFPPPGRGGQIYERLRAQGKNDHEPQEERNRTGKRGKGRRKKGKGKEKEGKGKKGGNRWILAYIGKYSNLS